MPADSKRIVFVMERGPHHVFHSMGTALELSKLTQDWRVEVVAARGNRSHIERAMGTYPQHRLETAWLDEPWWFRHFNIGARVYASPPTMFRRARKHLEGAAAIVSAAHETPRHAKEAGIEGPRFVYHHHGGGDYLPVEATRLAGYDLLLVAGDHARRRLAGLEPTTADRIRVIGYPKLDLCSRFTAQELPFPETRPVVLYTPHWRADLTSWPKWGRAILDFFAKSTKYNLICAPHLMLKQVASREGYDLDTSRWKTAENIHFDFFSERSLDMSYTRAAQLYLGDRSSQVYEFVSVTPRPCVFLNASGALGDESGFGFLKFGPVVQDLGTLGSSLERASDEPYLAVQRDTMNDYFSTAELPATQRAAHAILDFVEQRGGPS